MNANSLPPKSLVQLPTQAAIFSLAATCRETALSFMNECERWGKAELAMWLMGPYTRCAQYGTDPVHGARNAVPVLLREIDARFVDRIIGSAYASVIDTLSAEITAGSIGSFAFEMIDAGFVARARDTQGIEGWVPTTKPRRLVERVLSLFAADYLSRPPVFASEVSICELCRTIDFDRRAHHQGTCYRHESGFFGLHGPQSTLPCAPELKEAGATAITIHRRGCSRAIARDGENWSGRDRSIAPPRKCSHHRVREEP